jgi:hydrogenase maturation protein HypF
LFSGHDVEVKSEGPVRFRWRIRVSGIVQGVGFRPFVAGLAADLGVAGLVGNDSDGVFVEVEGGPRTLQEFVIDLSDRAPPLARIDSVEVDRSATPVGAIGFVIVASRQGAGRDALVAADAATCADCLGEIRDRNDRRFGYAFTNCTNCGPRFTIVRDVPYDRARTTMAGFTMCDRCQAEYDDPLDRRFHAQPVCCPACGPRLRLLDSMGIEESGDPIDETARLLGLGAAVAVKGIGGYHLAVAAADDVAVSRLREAKHREERPFAVMVADVEAARALCQVSEDESRLLAGPAAPIVLLGRRPGAAVSAGVAPGRDELGLMLAYTPLHHLLLAASTGPLVLTSGNRSDEPIAFDDADARSRLTGLAAAFLTHDRPIQTRADDSVVRVVGDRVVPIRRSRGYVPNALPLPWILRRPVLGCGPELKNTFCLGRGRHAFVSHHIGDLENYETLSSYVDGIEHLRRMFDIDPAVVAHDLHPEYLSTKYALDLAGVDLVGVQHHHAHIASCLADNAAAGPVIGVAFDGLGMGTDGSLWGGEFLVADLRDFERVAHLEPVPMPGGAVAIRQPWRMAAAYLDRAYAGEPPGGLAIRARHDRWDDVLAVERAGINSPVTSSMGRLFDAVSAVLGLRDQVSYEGQAAIELEQVAARAETGCYDVAIEDDDPLRINGPGLVREIVADRLSGTSVDVVAARFHNSVAQVVVDVCSRVRADRGLGTVALSGGVFQNVRLLDHCVSGLTDVGFDVLSHRRVPTNDGGVSLGQVAVAGARDRVGGAA